MAWFLLFDQSVSGDLIVSNKLKPGLLFQPFMGQQCSNGNPGRKDDGYCHESGHCDTEQFVVDVNTQGLCGSNDWRMPTLMELRSIVNFGRHNPAIDTEYFPNTPSASSFWSSSPGGGWAADSAWALKIAHGSGRSLFYHSGQKVRLVRDGQ